MLPAEALVQTNLNTEISRAIGAEAIESAARTSADLAVGTMAQNTLTAGLSTAAATTDANLLTLQTNLNSEVLRATAAEVTSFLFFDFACVGAGGGGGGSDSSISAGGAAGGLVAGTIFFSFPSFPFQLSVNIGGGGAGGKGFPYNPCNAFGGSGGSNAPTPLLMCSNPTSKVLQPHF